ncbi:MAG: Nramp family divalent metal transporter [Candidatus Solibacter usitatus]|nr:Nramp family divalent metal transporter [Candidatus Solibacter usitatus]
MDSAGSPSLPEVHSSVRTSHPSLVKRMFAFAGPAYLISVGYMDPGNWATDLEGGARFGYQLLWVLVLSNAMAILLQTLSARLGIAAGRDLAQACRDCYPKPVSQALWVLCEIAITACDLAELVGAAIGLNLLFGLPLIWGVALSAGDALFVLWFGRFGIRVVETIILGFVTVIAACFFVEIILARPVLSEVALGLIPRLNSQSLYVAIAMLGATVMPHNLYLHSSLVQTRRIGDDHEAKRSACRFNLLDSVVALNGALLVNAAILILAAATFFDSGTVVTQIQQAHHMLEPLLGTTLAGIVFAVALICAGQASTITGTMAGQVVMEGFLSFRMRPWIRRLLTRSLALIPAALVISFTGDTGAYKLLIFSQVVLSLQLPFAVIPLIRFTSSEAWMGELVNRPWVKTVSWTAAAIIVGLNAWLAWTELSSWPILLSVPLAGGLSVLLAWVTVAPFDRVKTAELPVPEIAPLEAAVYRDVLVTLDHSRTDRVALAHAISLVRGHEATLHLFHVEEGVTSMLYGALSDTAEIAEGRLYFDQLLAALRSMGVRAELTITHSPDPKSEIVRFARRLGPDLVVMGAHGHKGLKDIVFGATINEVRHALDVPVFVVRASGPE